MGENLFDKLDDYLITQIAKIIARDGDFRSTLALAMTCKRMRAIIVPRLTQWRRDNTMLDVMSVFNSSSSTPMGRFLNTQVYRDIICLIMANEMGGLRFSS